MVDKERVLSKLDELDGYLKEILEILPKNFKAYRKVQIKRSIERLLQLSVECTLDICQLLIAGLRLGLPADETDLFLKLGSKRILSSSMVSILKSMKGFRNILVHDYAEVDDELVYEMASKRLGDFQRFKKEILKFLKK